MSAKNSEMYRNKIILAPMVRVGTLPMRLLALTYGAEIVYTEEIIDYKLLRTVRRYNEVLDTVDYVYTEDGTLVLRTCNKEKDKLIVQLGTSCVDRALQAAKMLENDVAGIDINMGCPKSFSIKGGMGVALLYNKENAKKILKTLVENISKPITCKIRILGNIDETVKLAQEFQETGISAIAVHGRNKDERPQHNVHPDYIKAVAEQLKIPVIANGGSKEILKWEDINAFRDQSGASSVMIARAAEWNCSIFRKEGMLPLEDVIKEYLTLCIEYDNPPNNTKYCIQNMMRDQQESEIGRKLLDSATAEEICEIWGLGPYCREVQQKHQQLGNADRRELGVSVNGNNPAKKLRLEEDNDEIIAHKTIFLRTKYGNDTELPKSKLHLHSQKNFKTMPKYQIISQGKLFRAILTFEGKQYTSSYWEKNKKSAEQGAALACLLEKRLVDRDTLIKNESLLPS